jgi:hypothetical protein
VGSGEFFPTDEPVSREALIGRADDVDAIASSLLGAINVVLAGPRRLGKTSVARAALEVCRPGGRLHGRRGTVQAARLQDSPAVTVLFAGSIEHVMRDLFGPPPLLPQRHGPPPTRAERKAIIRAVHARQCESGPIRISTVDPHWASFEYGLARGFDFFSCPNVPTGRLFVHRSGRRWHVEAGGSDITCDERGLPPRRVQRDLRLVCRTP